MYVFVNGSTPQYLLPAFFSVFSGSTVAKSSTSPAFAMSFTTRYTALTFPSLSYSSSTLIPFTPLGSSYFTYGYLPVALLRIPTSVPNWLYIAFAVILILVSPLDGILISDGTSASISEIASFPTYISSIIILFVSPHAVILGLPSCGVIPTSIPDTSDHSLPVTVILFG